MTQDKHLAKDEVKCAVQYMLLLEEDKMERAILLNSSETKPVVQWLALLHAFVTNMDATIPNIVTYEVANIKKAKLDVVIDDLKKFFTLLFPESLLADVSIVEL